MALPKLSSIPGAKTVKDIGSAALSSVVTPISGAIDMMTSRTGISSLIGQSTGSAYAAMITDEVLGGVGSIGSSIAGMFRPKAQPTATDTDSNDGGSRLEEIAEAGLMTEQGTLGELNRNILELVTITEGMATNAAKQRLEAKRNSLHDVEKEREDKREQEKAGGSGDGNDKPTDFFNDVFLGSGLGSLRSLVDDVVGLFARSLKGIIAIPAALGGGILSIVRKFGLSTILLGGLYGAIQTAVDVMKGIDLAEEWGVSKANAGISAAFAGTGKGISNAFKNASKWAGIGATVGLIGGPVGALIGGLIGAAAGGLIGYLGGEDLSRGIKRIGDWANTNILAPIGDFLLNVKNAVIGIWDFAFPQFIKDILSGRNPYKDEFGNLTLSSVLGIWRKILPPFVVDLIDGKNPFTGQSFSLTEIFSNIATSIGEKITSLFDMLITSVRSFVIDKFSDQGMVGRKIAKQFMTEEEVVELDRKTRIRDLEDDIQSKKKDISKGITGLERIGNLFSDVESKDALELIKLQNELSMVRKEQTRSRFSSANATNSVERLQRTNQMIEVRHQTETKRAQPTIIAPQVIAPQSNNVVNNANTNVIMPKAVHNAEPSISRRRF